MPALVHTTFRVSNAKQFRESFEEKKENGIGGYVPAHLYSFSVANNQMELSGASVSATDINSIPTYALDDQIFLFIGRVGRWSQFDHAANEVDGTIDPNYNENNPPPPVDSPKDSHFNHWDDMIAAKKVAATEVSHVIKRERADEIRAGVRNWKAGLRYDEYDSRDPFMFDDDMLIHTTNEKFRVYKCIKRGIGKFTPQENVPRVMSDSMGDPATNTIFMWNYQSTREPLLRDISCDDPNGKWTENFMYTGGADPSDAYNDGYQWKYYYTIDAGQALKFVTTSYIPVKRLRKENGDIVDDSSDQYVVEEASIPGAILNVVTVKKEENGYDSTGQRYGYDPIGGDGYFQFAAKGVQISYASTAASNTMSFAVPAGSQIQALAQNDFLKNAAMWPSATVAQDNATFDPTYKGLNMFDTFTAGEARDWITNFGSTMGVEDDGVTTRNMHPLDGYGIVIQSFDNPGSPFDTDEFKRYVYPIDAVSATTTGYTFAIKTDFLDEIAYGQASMNMPLDIAGLPAGAFTEVAAPGATSNNCFISIHPIVKIDANFQSSTESDPIDAFQAYAIVEPKATNLTAATPEYDQTNPGRVIDVVVQHPGRFHYRVDRTYVANNELTGSATANSAIVWASIPPVGGHGWDPVEELGGFNVMINARFEGDEADEFTVKNEFRKIGILKNPLKYEAASDLNQLWVSQLGYDELFREYKTDQCYRLFLDGNHTIGATTGTGPLRYEPDMDVVFRNSNTVPIIGVTGKVYAPGDEIARARVVDHDDVQHRVRVIKPRKDWGTILRGGKFEILSTTMHSVENEGVTGNTKNTHTSETPGMKPFSGKILYIENRSMVSRSENQTEDLKISIQF